MPSSLGIVWLERSEKFRAFEMGILMVSIFLFLFFEVGVPVASVEISDSVREVEAKELEESATYFDDIINA